MAKASELVRCFGGVALAGGLKGGVGCFVDQRSLVASYLACWVSFLADCRARTRSSFSFSSESTDDCRLCMLCCGENDVKPSQLHVLESQVLLYAGFTPWLYSTIVLCYLGLLEPCRNTPDPTTTYPPLSGSYQYVFQTLDP